MPSEPRRIRIADDPPAAARVAAGEVATAARAAVAARGRFALALSGGRTPEPLLRRLGAAPYRDSLPWNRTLLFWADERCVPPEDPRSNFGTARRLLLDGLPRPPRAVRRIRGELPPAEAAATYEERLVAELGVPPVLDLVLLGLGEDGHTASLFPGDEGDSAGDRWAVATRAPEPPHERVSLTLRSLSAARGLLFLVTGGRKAEAVATLLGARDDAGVVPSGSRRTSGASAEPSPVARIRPAAPPLWILDAAASSRLGAA